MDKKETNIRVSGDVSGQLAIGDNITQKQTIETHQSQVSQVDMDALRQMLADLKVKVEAEAPDDKKDAALERVSELEEAITAEKPDLTTMEYDLLELLIRKRARVLNRDYLMESLKGYEWETFDRSIDVAISRLRHKLDDNAGNPRFIKTVRGVGYMFIG